MSLLIDDMALLKSLVSIGAKEEERKLKRVGQAAEEEKEEENQQVEKKPHWSTHNDLKEAKKEKEEKAKAEAEAEAKRAREEEIKNSNDARSFFLNSLNIIKNDQISNNLAKNISIEIQNTPEDLIKYLANNLITIGNEVIVSTFPADQLDKYKPLVKDTRYMISNNWAIRVDLLKKYLYTLRSKFAKKPAGVRVSELIEKTESYIKNPPDPTKMFGGDKNFSVENSSNEDSKSINDNTVLDSKITKNISNDTVPIISGQIMICVGDLKDDASITSWITKNKDLLVFIDDNENDPEKRQLTWDKDADETRKMKSILMNFLQKRSRFLADRSGPDDRYKYDKYVEYADRLSQIVGVPVNNQNKSNDKGSGQRSNAAQVSRNLINKIIATLPFDEKSSRASFEYQAVETLIDEMGPYLSNTRYNQNIQYLNTKLKAYTSDYANLSSLNVDESYQNLRSAVEAATNRRERRIDYYLTVLYDVINYIKLYLSDMKAYIRPAKLQVDASLLEAATNSIDNQIKYCDSFLNKIAVWKRNSTYDDRKY